MSTPFVGEMRMFGFSRVPAGWLPCNGQLLPISQNQALFSLIGTTYGGDGQTTFAVPDLRGRVPLHAGSGPGLSSRTLGEGGGTENVTLTAAQIGAHSHGFTATTSVASVTTPGPTLALGTLSGDSMYATDISGAASVTLAPSSISASGGGAPHENLMPTLTVQFCIAAEGIFPARS
ncbi:MAG: tail fiber protein [Nitrococcus sp.]|nr:tail fiber protein [Nitrococcus sp.]